MERTEAFIERPKKNLKISDTKEQAPNPDGGGGSQGTYLKGSTSSDEQSSDSANESLLDIKARISDRNVLLHIQCAKQKGAVAKAVTEIEKFNLTVINSSVMSFGTSAIDITALAQVLGPKSCMQAPKVHHGANSTTNRSNV